MILSIIATIVILGLIYWAVSLIPLPEPFPQIIRVLFIIIAVIYILSLFGVNVGLPLVPIR